MTTSDKFRRTLEIKNQELSDKFDEIKEQQKMTIIDTTAHIITQYMAYQEEIKRLQDEVNSLKNELENTKNKVSMGELSYTLLGLNGEEISTVQNAEKISGQSLQKIAREGTVQRAKYLETSMSKIDFESLSEEQLRQSTRKGSAYFRIDKAIKASMAYNDNQTEKQAKFYICPSLIFKLTNSNRQTINEFFKEYKLMIDDHNNKHQLTEKDNLKGKGFYPKDVIVIN